MTVTRTQPEVGFKALGVTITFNNDASVETSNLIARIWAAFTKNRRLLTCKHISPTKRLRFLQQVIQHALWCAGSLNLTARQCEMLRGTQQSMLRAVIHCKPYPDELPWDFFRRWALRIKAWKSHVGFIEIDELYYRLQFRWAGHLARIPEWRGESLATRLLHFRNTDWLKRSVAQHGHQGHVGRFRVWRWEQTIAKFNGTRWWEAAGEKEEWEENSKKGAKWRKAVRH